MTATSQPVRYINPEVPPDSHPGAEVTLPYGFGPVPEHLANKRIFFFDIDNCLYERSTRIHDMMQVKIHQYFKDHLALDDANAHELHVNYYRTYGLALEGLVRNHQVDALQYNSRVDDALDLKAVLHYKPELREMLLRLKDSHNYDYFWLVTNAYKNHALRVVLFLGLGDLFAGLTYCDYALSPIVCKPMTKYFHGCLDQVRVDYRDATGEQLKKVLFVDDSEINVKAAHTLGFGTVVHFVEVPEELAALRKKPDFQEYYGAGDNSSKTKIRLITNILDLEKAL